MRLTAEERGILAGERGEAPRRALAYLVEVGRFFGAEQMVPVASVHLMGDTESLGEAGIRHLEEWAALGAKAVVPAITDPRSCSFAIYRQVGQDDAVAERERRAVRAFEAIGLVTADTCVPYQTDFQTRFGEHLAWGDTGSVIYANSVIGARSNYEGGPSALAAALTGRVPAYGFHLDAQRRATAVIEVRDQPRELADWGALGCLIGRQVNDYWQVPAFVGLDGVPGSDALKHLGASLASYGSLAMFHVEGVTPEARTLREATGGRRLRRIIVRKGDLARTYAGFVPERPRADLVVFSAPQLSAAEVREIAQALAGKRVHFETRLYVTTNYQVKALADKLGYTLTIQDAGGLVIPGVCFYIMTPRELAQKFGYRTLVTNSAKLANIIPGYGYNPVLRPFARCIEAALTGRVV